MIDFGTDWRDEDSYTRMNNHSLKMWAWEFIRRNPEYWEYWNDSLKEYEVKMKAYRIGKELERQVVQKNSSLVGLLSGWGLKNKPQYNPATEVELDFVLEEDNPSVDQHDFYIIRWSAKTTWGFPFLSPPANNKPVFFRSDGKIAYEGKDLRTAYFFENELAIKFTLTKGLNKQIETAKKELERRQKALNIKPLNPKNKSAEWRRYIRILDANRYSIPRRRAASIIFPSNINAESAYSDALQRAKEIMKFDYRNWLL